MRGIHAGVRIFGDGYWNLTWSGIVALGLIMGAIFAVLSTFALQWIHRRAFESLPTIFLGNTVEALATAARNAQWCRR